ncbi:oxygen-dependent protoporphyrinogen oxidase [Fodinibius roseus]|uniref:Coproporphyrinogen III oxidase n=1 Tax=Fodinibius roseus TaxID=1194090 RepID=A0A1M4UGG3_9BACT|nr:protoporphyrinogen oxidase [Fodinibius roseus]SHE55754.1 oxygen-dependent protoporphyrinogen oxidase [Fodinibius roseus]
MTNKKTFAGILGAGISGLTTAYALQKEGISVTVYEQSDQVGGAIKSVRQDGWLVEEGPNTLMVKSQQVWDLLRELSLTDDTIRANREARRRFIAQNNTPVALPSSIGTFLKSPLISAGAKLRLLKEPFIAPSDADDESIASFIQRRLGQEPLDYGINPFVSGVYAGDPKKLSVKHTFADLWEMEQRHGSLLKGLIKKKKEKEKSASPADKSLVSFTEGNQMLPRALARALDQPVRTSCEVQAATRSSAHWTISGKQEGHAFQAKHEVLISTVPSHKLSPIFESDLFDLLTDIPYVPLSVIALGFTHEQVRHSLNGFGMLIPEVEHHHALGMLFSSTLFPGRAPDRHHLLTCFVGGARQPGLAGKSRAELTELLLPELNTLLGVEGDPVFTHHRFWKHAIPQYEVGYHRYLSAMSMLEEQYPGLLLSGNFRHGVSVPDCIRSGFTVARRATQWRT